MITQQLLDYIKQQLQQGVSKEDIKNALLSNGWQEQDIEKGFDTNNVSISFKQSLSEQPSQYTNPTTKSPMKMWKILVMSLVGVVVISGGGAGVALGARIWDPLWNPFRPNPEKVMATMVNNMEKVKTYQSSGDILIKTVGTDKENSVQLSLKVNSDSDFTDPKDTKRAVDVNFQVNFPFPVPTTEGKINAKNVSLALSVDARIMGDVEYLRLTNLNVGSIGESFLTMAGVDKSKFINQWIKVDPKELVSMAGISKGELSKVKQNQEGNDKEIIKNLKDLVFKNKIFKLKKEMPDEKINGKMAYHYVFSLDKDNVKEAVPELLKIIVEASSKSSVSLPVGNLNAMLSQLNSTSTKEEINQAIDEFFTKIGGLDVEVWIGKKDYLLYQVKLDKEIEASIFKKGAQGKLTIKFDLTMSKFNEPMKIEVPKNAVDIKDILSGLMSPLKKLNQSPSAPLSSPTKTNNIPKIPNPQTFSKTNFQTSTWKLYRNKKYGFEFKYPSFYGVEEEEREMFGGPKVSIGGMPAYVLDIHRNTSLAKIKDAMQMTVEGNGSDVVWKDTTVASQKAIEVHYKVPGPGGRYYPTGEVGFAKGKNGYIFDLLNGSEQGFHQILSTFRFIK